jgi:hypothetical protein
VPSAIVISGPVSRCGYRGGNVGCCLYFEVWKRELSNRGMEKKEGGGRGRSSANVIALYSTFVVDLTITDYFLLY